MKSKATSLLLFVIIGLGLFALHLFVFPNGVDFYYSFQNATLSWLQNEPVFTKFAYFEAPWLLPLMAALFPLTMKGAEAALALLGFAGIFSGWQLFSPPTNPAASWFKRLGAPLALAACIFNLHFFDLIERGQVDAWVMIGILMMYLGLRRNNPYWVGGGWCFATTRPTSIFLLGLYTVWLMYRRGQLRQALTLPVLMFGVSLIVFDPGWPGRWWTHLQLSGGLPTWTVTLWRAADRLQIGPIWPTLIAISVLTITAIIMWRYRPELRLAFAFLTVTSLLVTPYALSYHYSVLMALFISVLFGWRVWLFIPLYALTWTPALRLLFGLDSAWIDIILPFAAWALLIWQISSEARQPLSPIAASSDSDGETRMARLVPSGLSDHG